jgi:hypothetical protein
VASATAAIVGAITNPYAERADEAYRHGAQTGLVIRYTVLGALAAGLADLLIARRRRGELGRAGLLQAAALVVVVLAMAIPPFVGGYDGGDELRDQHAGFVDGCSANQPRRYCECLWSRLNEDPAADSTAEREAITDRFRATGRPPAVLQKAVDACAKLRTP